VALDLAAAKARAEVVIALTRVQEACAGQLIAMTCVPTLLTPYTRVVPWFEAKETWLSL
jgi:hypothetical protein